MAENVVETDECDFFNVEPSLTNSTSALSIDPNFVKPTTKKGKKTAAKPKTNKKTPVIPAIPTTTDVEMTDTEYTPVRDMQNIVEQTEEILTEEDKRILENADVITGPEALKQFAIPLYLEGKRHIYCFNHDVDPLTKYKMSEYPTSSDSLCYKCFKPIQGVPLMPPRLYDDKRKIYTLVRFHMCSVACVLDYYWHNHERIFGQLKSMFCRWMREFFGYPPDVPMTYIHISSCKEFSPNGRYTMEERKYLCDPRHGSRVLIVSKESPMLFVPTDPFYEMYDTEADDVYSLSVKHRQQKVTKEEQDHYLADLERVSQTKVNPLKVTPAKKKGTKT